ncbi:MAG TPA: DinB family protein [Pyrinomonadaceae bacterium]
MSLSQPIIAELQQEAKTTRKLLERVPEEAFSWKPHEKSMSLGRLAGHVAELHTMFRFILTEDELDFAAGKYQPFAPSNVSELLESFDRNVAEAVELLKAQTDESLLKPWRMRSGEQVFFELPRVAVIRSMALNHIFHHRGQLSVYLRLRDVPLPSIYGPTADEPMV